MEIKGTAMISQPMHGKTFEEIVATRNMALDKLHFRSYEVVNTLFTEEYHSWDLAKNGKLSNRPLFWLAKSLEAMSRCDAVYFCKGWENYRGCKIEHDAAVAYGLEIIYEE